MGTLTLTFLTLQGFGQFPFEKYPAIQYREIKNWKVYDKCQTENKIHYTLTIPEFYKNQDSLTIRLTSLSDNTDTSYIRVYRNSKQIQLFIEPYNIGSGFECNKIGPAPQTLYLEDINGDGLNDLKILIPENGACGGYNYYATVIYLFQKTDGTFTKISFTDLMMEYINRPERDIDGDGNYEIITQTFLNYETHNYWLFNLYNFTGMGLKNVNDKDNYPILVQLLYRNNYAVTDKVPRQKMKAFAKKLPDRYHKM